MTTSTVQFTSLFSNQTLAGLERMRLLPHRRQTNRSRGEHLSGKGGSSIEFADYRDYVPGDDLRAVDWNIFARIQRPYVKLYRQEEEMHVVVIVDASSSMMFGDKLLRARQLAAAFGVMGLFNQEPVSLYACRQRGDRPASARGLRGRPSLKRLLAFAEGVDGGGNNSIDEAVDDVLLQHRGRGVAVVLSDFLTLGELDRPLNLLFRSGLEVFAIQLLSPEELDPEINGDLRLVDSETDEALDVSSVGDLLAIYQEHLAALQSQLQTLCQQRNGRFLAIDASTPIETLLSDTLRRKGWVR